MKIFIIVRDDVTVANGVVFAPGAIVVHSLLRRDRDSVTRFPTLVDVKHRFSGCKLQMVETSREATYSYVVRKAASKTRKVARKAVKKTKKSAPKKKRTRSQ
jgi:GTP-binding protein EngB required for normal cell division